MKMESKGEQEKIFQNVGIRVGRGEGGSMTAPMSTSRNLRQKRKNFELTNQTTDQLTNQPIYQQIANNKHVNTQTNKNTKNIPECSTLENV